MSDITLDAPARTTVDVPHADRHRQRGPEPRHQLRAGVRLQFTLGQTIVTCTARDANGNTSVKTFTVTLRGTQPVGGTVPATLALTLGAPASFGAFTAGVAKDYTATTSANVISTAGDAAQRSSDPGHLMNGTFALPDPLRVEIAPATWTGPVSNAAVAITFRQLVKATDALRTGAYSKTLTFTSTAA